MRSKPMWAIQISASAKATVEPTRKARNRQRQRQRIGMDEIVGERARSRPDEIGEHRKIRPKEKNCEREPWEAGVAVKRNRRAEGGRALEAQNAPDSA